jgi:very-short-patch-repair endonuclease
MVTLECLWCGESFQRKESYLKSNGARVKFCSKECNGAYTARYKQNSVSAAETAFFDRLEAAGLRFNRQAQFKKFVIDAICVEKNIAIEFDGDYWHSLEHVKAKDKRKSDALERAGYELIRVPEYAWVEHPDSAIEWVLEIARTL